MVRVRIYSAALPMFLYYAAIAFKLWMLVDCARRRGEAYWYLIILFPLGAWAYFFLVKIHDFNLGPFKRLLGGQRAPTLSELRYQTKQTPSSQNKVRLADALYDAGQQLEAAELFREALETHPEDPFARYGLGLCLLQLGEVEQAIVELERVVEDNFSFRDCTAALELASALKRADRRDEATSLLDRVVTKSPSLKHRLAFAEHLIDIERTTEARQLLAAALEDYDHAPQFVKRRDRQHHKAALELNGWLQSVN